MSGRYWEKGHVTLPVSRDVTLPAVTKRRAPPAKKQPKHGRIHSDKASAIVRFAVPPGLVVYADGCCEPNPGIGGWGFVVYRDGEEVYSESGGDLEATNQRMELTAAIRALAWVSMNIHSEAFRLISDSAYVVNGSNDWRHKWKGHGWRKKSAASSEKNQALANLDLWKALDAALTAVPIELEWCKGHAGIIGNERADELSLIGRASAIEARRLAPLDLIRQQLDYSARGEI